MIEFMNKLPDKNPRRLFKKVTEELSRKNSYWAYRKISEELPGLLMTWERVIGSSFNLKSGCQLPYKIVIGTHHKTGTMWLDSIFRRVCMYHGLKYNFSDNKPTNNQYDIFFECHSSFDWDVLEQPFRGLHLIRDPRDVIISGCFYHQVSHEKWLKTPRTDLKGLTYQQAINRYEKLEDKILFEMEHVGYRTISDMLNWNYANPCFYEGKYEDLIGDSDLDLFYEIFKFLGFPGSAIPSVLAVAYNKSLFSGVKNQSPHIRSGKKKQWVNYFEKIHRKRFVELFGDGLLKLGYEKDNEWIMR